MDVRQKAIFPMSGERRVHRLMRRAFFFVCAMALSILISGANVSYAVCKADFFNPITDICWQCIFPIRMGGIDIIGCEREGNNIDTRHSGFVTSDAWLAVLGQCLRINSFPRGKIVLGVPPGMYSKTFSQRILEVIRKSDMRVNGVLYRITGDIRIIPQGAGIFFRHVKDYQDDYRKNVAVIDIGHHTVDMVLFSAGRYVESARESQEIGVSLLLDSIVRAFYREHRFSIGLRDALDILRSGQMTHLGKIYTVEIQEEVIRYTRRFESVMDRYLEKLPLRPDIGVMGGGGAVVINHLVDLTHHLLMVNEPVMANAVGYWLYGGDET